jgi:hypothetical protein
MSCCEQCQFYFPNEPTRSQRYCLTIEADGVVYGCGQCHRHAPIADKKDYYLAKFPIVPPEYWCGDFISKQTGVPA